MDERDRMLVVERKALFCEWKLTIDSKAATRYLHTHLFGHCHVSFPYQEILPFLDSVTGHFHTRMFFPFSVSVKCHFHIWNLFHFLVGLCRKSKQLVVQIYLFRKRLSNHLAAVMMQVIPSYHTNYSKNTLFIPANTYEKYILSKKYCIARHDDKICFLPKGRYHIILLGDIKELLQKLNAFCFNYQHVDCLYTLFKYRFSGKTFVNSGQFFGIVQKAVHFNHQNKTVE